MNSIVQLTLGVVALFLAVPIGLFLAHFTKEELKQGKKYFFILCCASAVGAIVSLVLGKDIFLFTFLFMGIVTSISLR